MNPALFGVALALCCAFAGSAGAADRFKIDRSAKDRIEAEYKIAKDHCKDLKDNARDICKVEAKGKYNVAKAELEVQADPSPRHQAKLQKEKADAAYQLAKEKCDDLNGNAKDACRKDAKAAFVSAKGDAKVSKAAWIEFAQIVLPHIGATPQEMLLCGMSIGYADENDKVNSFHTPRVAVEEFTRWLD
jgi:hypothetical protein